MRIFFCTWVAALLLIASATAQREQESGPIACEAFPDLMPLQADMLWEEPPMPVSLALEDAFQKGRNLHEFAPLTTEDIVAADRAFEESPCHEWPGPARVGLVRRIEPVPLSIDGRFAVPTELADGQTVWTLAIRSPEAYAIRVHFINFDAGRESVIVYAQDSGRLIVHDQYGGGGTSRDGHFWTPSLPGDTVFIEVTGKETPGLQIPEICHFDHNPAAPGSGDDDGRPSDRELSCHIDVNCADPPVPAAARDATGKMNVICGDFATGCTGTLLNDLDDETFVPYFLTAYHCLSTQAEVDTMEVVWLWQTDECNGTLPDYFALPRNCGGTLLETNPTSGGNDMTFIRLAGEVPPGVSLAGWTTGHPDPAIGVHHPSTGAGSWKRVVFLTDVGFCPGCEVCGDGTDYDYYDMAMGEGLIEGGSSGSGVFNTAGQLAGQLYGTCCVVPACDDEVYDCNEYDEYEAQYGEFETTYPIILRWLEIGGTLHVDGGFLCVDIPPCRLCGTPSQPYTSVSEANDCAWDGARIKIHSGSYPETLTFSKHLLVLAEAGAVTIGE